MACHGQLPSSSSRLGRASKSFRRRERGCVVSSGSHIMLLALYHQGIQSPVLFTPNPQKQCPHEQCRTRRQHSAPRLADAAPGNLLPWPV